MYDIHCHIIPGVDDGAYSMSETLDMLDIAVANRTKGIICTPHCNIPRSFSNYWNENLEERFNNIVNEVRKKNIQIELYKGQEIFLSGNFLERLKNNELITLCDSDYVLVEFYPFEKEFDAFKKLVSLVSEGYKPIVAHPERYEFVVKNTDAIGHIKDLGCLIQVNKGSLKGRFGKAVMVTAHNILAKRAADFVASDAHSPYKRTPNLTDVHEMISTEYSADYADFLLKENPYKVISNKQIYRY
ncbi:MAG: hypothetical protein IKT61_06310 [Clostridia bacterium]|nr:hypothetical protein [Clostridia bacterium]